MTKIRTQLPQPLNVIQNQQTMLYLNKHSNTRLMEQKKLMAFAWPVLLITQKPRQTYNVQ